MPEKTIVAEAPRKRRRSGGTLRTVTPARMRRATRAARQGEPAALFALLEHFHNLDDEIPSALGSLIAACIQDTVEVVPLGEATGEAMEQVALTERVLEDFGLHELLEELLLCHYYPARAAAPAWDAYGFEGTSYQAPVRFDLLPDWWVYATTPAGGANTVPHVGRLPVAAYEPGDLLFMAARRIPKREDVDFRRYGRGLACLRFGIYSWYNYEDWAAYNEVVGIPTVVGTLLDGFNDTDEEFLREAVYGLQSDSRAVKTERTHIELIERKGGGQALFKDFGQECGRIKSKLLKGESLTNNMNGRGSNAAMRTTNGIRLDVAQKIDRRAEKLLQTQLVNPFLDLNFRRRRCRVKLRVRPAPDLEKELKIDRELARLMDLSESELRQRYGRSAPTSEEDAVATGTFDPFAGA